MSLTFNFTERFIISKIYINYNNDKFFLLERGRLLNFDALKTFVTLAEVKHFTKTAEILTMSQPNVSLHIKNLENELQSKLFTRTPKNLHLTSTGELLYERAKQIISITEKTKQDILDHHHTVKGTIKIGASFTIGEYLIPSLIYDVQQKYPDLEIQVIIGNTEEIVNHVKLFEVDLGLIEGQTNDKEVKTLAFMEDELLIVASPDHPITNKKSVSISDLQNQTWIRRETGSGTREYLEHVIRSNGLKVNSFLTISSNQGVKELIMRDMGLSLLSYSVVKREVELGLLSVIPLDEQSFTRAFSYVYLPMMTDKRNVQAFINAIQHRYTTL